MNNITKHIAPAPRSARPFRLLRMCLLLAFLACIPAGALRAQEAKVTFQLREKPLSTLLAEIQKQTGYKIFYSDNNVDVSRKVNVSARQVPVNKVLESILPKLGLTYQFINNTIVLSQDPKAAAAQGTSVMAKAVPVRTVSGVVRDEAGKPMVGVSVISMKDRQRGTSTAADGTFSFRVPADETQVTFSMIGMKTQTLPVGSGTLDVTMKSDVIESEALVITGFVPKAKNSFTGTATQVKGADLVKVNPTNVLQALQVYDPSFVISDITGEFGSNPNHIPDRIEIRGANSMPDISENTLQTYTSLPIFILDGFQVEVEKVYNLDINRVENVTILKDAAASSIYGSRAANGVVVITTKMPQKGSIQISYTLNTSIETPDLSSYNLMNSKELVQYYEKMDIFSGGSGSVDPERRNLLAMLKMEAANGVDTYWLAQPLRTAFKHSHSLVLEGGTDVGRQGKDRTLRYQINLNGNFSDGVMIGSLRNNYGGGAKLIYDTHKLQLTSDLQVGFTDTKDSPYGDFSTYTQLLPVFRIKDSHGDYFPSLSANNIPLYENYPWTGIGSNVLGTQINPLYEANNLNNFSRGNNLSLTYQLGANWEIVRDLRLRGEFSYNRQEKVSERYVSPFSSAITDGLDNNSIEQLYRRGSYDKNNATSTSYYGKASLSYQKSFARHTVQAVLGGEIKEDNAESDSYSVTGFLNDSQTYPSDGAQYPLSGRPTGSSSIVRMAGAFATVNYSFDNRYMVDGSYRVDGSSNFASKQRISSFWAVGVRWNVMNEKFMNRKVFDNFALKANIGTTGNSNFALSQILNMYKYLTMYDGITGAELMSLANPDLKWQTTLKRNIGLELGFLRNRINLEFNYYSNTTDNNITRVNILPSTGFSSYTANQGDVSNKGFDFNLSVTPVRTKNWQFNVFVNGQHNRNKLTNLSEALKDYNKQIMEEQTTTDKTKIENVFLFEEGKSLTAIYAVRSAGIDPGTGQEIFITKDGKRTFTWNSADQVVVGDTEPDLRGYFGVNLSYKRWSLNTSFEYSFGGEMYNQTLVDRIENTSMNNSVNRVAYNMDRRALYDRWSEPGQSAKYRGINVSGKTYASSRFVQKNNYLRMNSIRIMYNLNSPDKRLLGMSMLRIALSANDLFYASTIRQERGLSYPYARTFTLSLQANF
ncbi:TonB-linked outer membrane protein, SusC/RagA family [Alistipes timonensis JC136]|uniref:TonB-linked outer membrane protein, SusC/RagA family n=1 Tax=Alistipes timonensis JC136 TaxID=1033731 RepID=A0A1H4D9F3_9BACT|nr:SusC/RagA family TonB-linked outer membrane protein [Alistipes timonensis]SEA68932.1 TonB-linked outer membrane protein, SusC/RagA family [Alistipes timonensis JC136]